MIDKQLAADVLTAALSNGGGFAEIFVERNVKNAIVLTNGAVESAQSDMDYGAGIRIFNGLNAVYVYTNDTSRDSLIKLALQAAGAVRGKKGAETAPFAVMNYDRIHMYKTLFDTVSKKRIADMLRPASESAFAYNPAVTQTTVRYTDSVQDVLIVNSEGLWAEDRRVRTHTRVAAVASSATEKQTGYNSRAALRGFEFYDGMDFRERGEQAAETAVTMLNAKPCPSGRMPVVIENGFGGVIFHEACGHSLEATAVAKGASEFSGKIGERIASDIVTAIDDGTMPNEWGSMNIDDEGTKMQRNVLIENGVLKSYLVDRLNGLRMGAQPTGSSRRESYRFAPTSRMSNTYIAPGKDKDIIGDTEYGLYARRMGGGSVQPSTGEFNFAVAEAYIIRNGKICEPVRGATLIGKGSEVLLGIDRVSDNLAHGPGMCGSISGSVPTNCGQPALRVKELTVGGRGGI